MNATFSLSLANDFELGFGLEQSFGSWYFINYLHPFCRPHGNTTNIQPAIEYYKSPARYIRTLQSLQRISI